MWNAAKKPSEMATIRGGWFLLADDAVEVDDPIGWEPLIPARIPRLIGPRGGVSEPGEEDRCSACDPAKPHWDHQSSPRRGHGDGPAENGARQLQDGDRSKDDRHDQGVTL